ncbi:MAG: hypothetical protein L6R41_007916 [Letrouitia leprolyta]|nr:MAG: hypothetical protein L6R41_007916 [Letrouitia leprolyta]
MKEEVKLVIQGDVDPSPVQDEQPNARHDKLSSPQMETMEEASQFSYLIPQLATKVHNIHQDSTMKLVEDEERQYRLLQKDIQEIERGDWDARLQHQEIVTGRDIKGVASIHTLLQNEPETNQAPAKASNDRPPTPLPSIQGKLPAQTAPGRENQHQPNPHVNGDHGALEAANAEVIQQGSPPVASLSPPKVQPPLHPLHELPSNTPRPSSQSGSAENGIPFLPPPPHIQQGYHKASPPSELHRRQSSQPANIAPSPTIRTHQTPLPPPERSSGSPIILPPPPGMLHTTSSPSRPLDALAEMSGQQYRPNAMQSPRPLQSANNVQHPVQLPLPQHYAQRPSQYPPYDNRTPYHNAYSPYHQGSLPAYPSQHHAHVLPYQHLMHTPGQSPHYAPRPQYQTPVPTYSQYPPYPHAPSYTPQGPMAFSHAQYQTPRPFDQQSPIPTSDIRRKPPRPSPINTSGSCTKWKNFDLPPGDWSPKSPVRPRQDEISPISEKASSPGLEPSRNMMEAMNQQDPASSTVEEPIARVIKPPPARGRRGRPPRGGSTRGRGGRAASTPSSARQTRTRSASMVSGADELSLEPPTSASHHAAVKPEPPATPARDSSASVPPTSVIDADGKRKSTRHRRETLRGIESTVETSRTGTKRKRTIDTSDLEFQPTIRLELDKQKEELSTTHILASRNFPRTSATLINDITGHKHASIFAKPLTEREAPGYHSLIYRAQDLKSIKQAITNGNKALISLIDRDREDNDKVKGGKDKDTIPIAGASDSDMRVWVKKQEDIVPPKGIVNSAQLEREIMRVFANAVMFNPDPNRSFGPAFRTRARRKERHVPARFAGSGDEAEEEEESEVEKEEEEGAVVRDTREMFEDVERVAAQWRAAEKAAEEAAAAKMGSGAGKGNVGEEEEADELAGEESGVVGEEEVSVERAGKRRRR